MSNSANKFAAKTRAVKVVILTLASLWHQVASSQSCLDQAASYAERICGEIQKSGYSQVIEADGQLKAGISGILSRVLGTAGVSTGGATIRSSYENVLRQDLAKELFNVRECRMRMAEAARTQVCKSPEPTVSQSRPQGQVFRDSFPGEYWRTATIREVSWLADEWCYPSLPGFFSRFRVEGTRMLRQNEAKTPPVMKTEWLEVSIHRSNRDALRLTYPGKPDWPPEYIHFQPRLTAEHHYNERAVLDDGTVRSSQRKLVLSCKRCALEQGGLVYNCTN
jgi:hypothetical protein